MAPPVSHGYLTGAIRLPPHEPEPASEYPTQIVLSVVTRRMVRRCMNVMLYDETAFDVHVVMIDSSLGAGHSTYFRFLFVFIPLFVSLERKKVFGVIVLVAILPCRNR